MATTANAEILQKYKSKFSLIEKNVLVLASSTNLVREVKNFSPDFDELHSDVLRYG